MTDWVCRRRDWALSSYKVSASGSLSSWRSQSVLFWKIESKPGRNGPFYWWSGIRSGNHTVRVCRWCIQLVSWRLDHSAASAGLSLRDQQIVCGKKSVITGAELRGSGCAEAPWCLCVFKNTHSVDIYGGVANVPGPLYVPGIQQWTKACLRGVCIISKCICQVILSAMENMKAGLRERESRRDGLLFDVTWSPQKPLWSDDIWAEAWRDRGSTDYTNGWGRSSIGRWNRMCKGPGAEECLSVGSIRGPVWVCGRKWREAAEEIKDAWNEMYCVCVWGGARGSRCGRRNAHMRDEILEVVAE